MKSTECSVTGEPYGLAPWKHDKIKESTARCIHKANQSAGHRESGRPPPVTVASALSTYPRLDKCSSYAPLRFYNTAERVDPSELLGD